jgi:hypothetical protein
MNSKRRFQVAEGILEFDFQGRLDRADGRAAFYALFPLAIG